MSSSSTSFSTMSLTRSIPPYPQTTLFTSSSTHLFTNLPLRVHHHRVKLFASPRQWRNFVTSCSCSSPSSDSFPIAEDENGELRECISEILVEFGVSEVDSHRIASNSPKYAKMLRDSVRDLDELDLWNSWMKMEEEMTSLSFKDKVKHIAKEKGDDGKIPYLESVGLSLSSSIHLARVLSSESLPCLMHKVKYVRDIFFSGSDDKGLVGKLARRMMFHLSISVDEDVQQTLSFFEKIEARRGGLDMLGSADASFRHLIESFPRLLLLSVEANVKPTIKFLESIGVPRQHVGNVLLLYPPLLFLDVEDGIRPRLLPFHKAGVLDKDLGRILVKYPWVLSKSISGNYDEIFDFLDYEKVPKACIAQAIMDWPILLGGSVENLKPMVEVFSDLGVRTTKLGKVLATSPQLLLQKPIEFQKVVSLLQDLGLSRENVGKILIRCPEISSTSTEKTLQKKLEFLTSLGILKQQIPRVVKKYPEIFVSDVDRTVMPRLRYLMKYGLSERDVVSMVTRFSPLVGYSIEQVLKPKLEFLLDTMGRPIRDVVDYPRYFSYSLDKKIKPRFFTLRSRNINCSLKDMLAKNDDEFVAQYLGIENAFVSIR